MKRKVREEQNGGAVATGKRKKEEDMEAEDGEEQDGETISPNGEGEVKVDGGGEAKIKFTLKSTTPLNKGFSFKSKPPPKPKKGQPKAADVESKPSKSATIVQLPKSYDAVAVFESTCPFFAGSGLDDLPATSTATLKSGSSGGGWPDEWEWEEGEDSSDGEWAPWGTKTSKNDSLLAAFNAVQLRRWVEEAETKQEALFVAELRRRTEQEREKERERERERERKEKEKEDAEAAAATTATGKKKPAAKTTTGKRKGPAAAATAAAATPVAAKGAKGKGAKAAKAAKPAKKPKVTKGKAGAKKDDAGQSADGIKKERDEDGERERDEENGIKDIDEAYLTLWERLRLDMIRSKSEDPAFARYASFPIDRLSDVKVSLTVNLYPNGFSLGGTTIGEQQSVSYPYDSSTKDFVKTIDSLRLPPDFVELLDEMPCVYYDGCLVVEVRDFRGNNTSALTGGAPVIRRVLLQPDTETIVSDVEQICADHADWTSDDCLKIEQSLVLATAPPLCLEPDIKVGLVANVLNYNKCKYNLTRTAKKKILSASDARGEKAAMPKKGGVSFALMDFLNKKNYRPSQSAHDNDTLPLSRKPLKDVDKTKKVTLPIMSLAHVRSLKKSPLLPKRAIQFHGRDGRSYSHLELRPNQYNNGYEAVISEGMSAETVQENPTPFPLGNVRESELFFTQVKTLYAKEGKICLYDSAMVRAPAPQMPNLKTTAPGGGGAMRPNPQQQAYMSMMRRTANTQLSGGRQMTHSQQQALYQQLASQAAGGNANYRAAAAAAAAAAAGQQQMQQQMQQQQQQQQQQMQPQQPSYEPQRGFMPGGYPQMATNAGQATGMPPGGMPVGQSNGPLTPGQMSGLPMSPQSIPHSGQPQGAPMSGPLTPGGSQAVPPQAAQMGPGGGQVPPSVGQVGGGPMPGGVMGGMVGGGMGGGPGMVGGMPSAMGPGMGMYSQGGMPAGAPPGGAMNPMLATYRRGSAGAAPMRGQPVRGRAMPASGGPMAQGQPASGGAGARVVPGPGGGVPPAASVGMMSPSGVPSPSTMGPPSSPSLTAPSTPTTMGPMTPTSMGGMSTQPPMGMPMGMQQTGMPMSPMSPMSPTGMMPNPMGAQPMGMGMQPIQNPGGVGMPQGMPSGPVAGRAQHPQERKFLLENMQQRK